MISLALPLSTRSELIGYSESSFIVYEAGRPRNRVPVIELNEARALIAASIHLGVSAEKLRAHPAPGHLHSAELA